MKESTTRLRTPVACALVAVLAACALAGCLGVFSAATPQAFAGNDLGAQADVDEGASSGGAATQESPLEKAKRLIAALPSDPDSLTEADRAAVDEAADAYDALSRVEQDELDSIDLGKEQSYGRWLESAQWGLEAQQPIDNSLDLLDGDYSEYVSSSSSMGKSNSQRARTWSVTKLVVTDGAAIATVLCGSTSSFKSMRVGGVDYPATVVDGVPQFDVPLVMNGTTTFTVDANAIADSVAYRITTAVPLRVAAADDVSRVSTAAQSALSTASGLYVAEDAALVKQAAQAMADAAAKDNVTVIELDVVVKAFNAVVASAERLSVAEDDSGSDGDDDLDSDSDSDSESISGEDPDASDASTGSASKSPGDSSTSNGSQSSSATKSVTGASGSQTVPTVAGKASTTATSKSNASASKSAAAASKTPASESSTSDDSAVSKTKVDVPKEDTPLATSSSEVAKVEKAEAWMGVIAGGLVLALLLAGMCLRTFLFVRAKDKS